MPAHKVTATTSPQQDRTFPHLQGKAHHDLVQELTLLRGSLYDLRDIASDRVDVLLTANLRFEHTLVAGKPLLVIARQDTTGGRTITWASKFHGTNLIAWVTTANTYSVFEFYPLKTDYAVLTRWLSGGNL